MNSNLVINNGLCQCGCGGITSINKQSHTKKKLIIGQHKRFLPGHGSRVNPPTWSGGKHKSKEGYILVLNKNHPRQINGYVPEQILIIEKAIGKYLRNGALGHHWNGDKSDNRNKNLLACNDENYHRIIHKRTRAFYASGHPDWLKCKFCWGYDDPKNLQVYEHNVFHKKCRSEYRRKPSSCTNGRNRNESHINL